MAPSLPALRTAYLALFRENEEVRVLLMNLRQPSHRPRLANASRVFIVNPIWRINVEIQAIERPLSYRRKHLHKSSR